MKRQKRFEFIVAVCMAAVSLVLFILANRIKGETDFTSGTKLVPVIATTLMLVFALFRCCSIALVTREPTCSRPQIEPLKWSIAIIALIAYATILDIVGFIIATIALLIALSPLFGIKKIHANLTVSVSITICLWLLFTKVFGSYLPPGIIY